MELLERFVPLLVAVRLLVWEILEEKLPIEERLRAGEKYVAAGWNGSIKAKYQMLLEEYRRKQKE